MSLHVHVILFFFLFNRYFCYLKHVLIHVHNNSKCIFFINLLLSYILVFWTYFFYVNGTIGDQRSSASFKPVEIYALVDPRVGCQAGPDPSFLRLNFPKWRQNLQNWISGSLLWSTKIDNEDVLLDLHTNGPLLFWISGSAHAMYKSLMSNGITIYIYIDNPTVIQMIVVMLICLSKIFIQSSRSIFLVLQYKQNRM